MRRRFVDVIGFGGIHHVAGILVDVGFQDMNLDVGLFQGCAPGVGLTLAEQEATGLVRLVHKGRAGLEGAVESPTGYRRGVSLDGGLFADAILGAAGQKGETQKEGRNDVEPFHDRSFLQS